ncbi:Hypothetical predicted protein [Marmota monax]|uniref:Uncharacterized protein n=1 Tax=Marmota monax TaxID=9995 RepID=A0A5E4A662_MARMO|nr:Hypothetical predicted protein [Marmota monax]
MGEIEQKPTPGSRLGAPENSGISTLEHGQKPPPTPSGKLMSIKIQMLDDTQEAFEVPQCHVGGAKRTGVEWSHVGPLSRPGHDGTRRRGSQVTGRCTWLLQSWQGWRGTVQTPPAP